MYRSSTQTGGGNGRGDGAEGVLLLGCIIFALDLTVLLPWHIYRHVILGHLNEEGKRILLQNNIRDKGLIQEHGIAKGFQFGIIGRDVVTASYIRYKMVVVEVAETRTTNIYVRELANKKIHGGKRKDECCCNVAPNTTHDRFNTDLCSDFSCVHRFLCCYCVCHGGDNESSGETMLCVKYTDEKGNVGELSVSDVLDRMRKAEEKNELIALANSSTSNVNAVEASAPSGIQMSRNNTLEKDDVKLVEEDALAPDYAPDGVEIQGRTSFSTVESIFCHKCGTKKYEPSQQFCHKCGEQFI